MRCRTIALTLAATFTAFSTVAACSAGGSGSASPPASPSPSAHSEVEILALAKQTAQCVRSNGLPGFPDPYFENGKLTLPDVDANVRQQGQAALDGPCHDLWQRLQAMLPEEQGNNGSNPNRVPVAAADLPKVAQFTNCLRQHGLPNWPDADGTGTYHLAGTGIRGGLGKGNMPEDTAFREALDACKDFYVNGIGFEL